MESIEGKVKQLLDGAAVSDNPELCDFSLSTQNEATAAKGIAPSTPSDYVPIVRRTVTYIVAAVLFNEQNEVLLIQEAKRSCAGQWYLPGGRMEPGENVTEAAMREVEEETGLLFEPTKLLMVEVASKAWFRFVLTGRITGGSLKTPAQADAESLQAKWINDLSLVTLRSDDIVGLIDKCKSMIKSPHYVMLPVVRPHSRLLIRLLICIRAKANNRVHVLVSEKTEAHLPLCEINHNRNLHSTLRKFMVDIFGVDVAPHRPHGLLSVEHCGSASGANDGLCLTILVSFRDPMEQVFPIAKYSWLGLQQDLANQLLSRLPKNMTLPLNVIR